MALGDFAVKLKRRSAKKCYFVVQLCNYGRLIKITAAVLIAISNLMGAYEIFWSRCRL